MNVTKVVRIRMRRFRKCYLPRIRNNTVSINKTVVRVGMRLFAMKHHPRRSRRNVRFKIASTRGNFLPYDGRGYVARGSWEISARHFRRRLQSKSEFSLAPRLFKILRQGRKCHTRRTSEYSWDRTCDMPARRLDNVSLLQYAAVAISYTRACSRVCACTIF